MNALETNIFVKNNHKEILNQIWNIVKQDVIVKCLNPLKLTNNKIKITLELYYEEDIVTTINMKNLKNNISVSNFVDRILNNLMSQLKNKISETKEYLIFKTYHQDFYNQICEKVNTTLNFTGFECVVTPHVLQINLKKDNINIEIPLKKIKILETLFKVEKKYKFNKVCIPTKVKMKYDKDITINKFSEYIVKYLKSNSFSLKAFNKKNQVVNKYKEFNNKNCNYLINNKFSTNQIKFNLMFRNDVSIFVSGKHVMFKLNDTGEMKLVYNSKFKTLLDIVNNSEFQRVKKELDELFKKYNIQIKSINGPGIYFGDTTFYYKCNNLDGQFIISYRYDNKKWFDEIIDIIEKKLEKILKKKQQKEQMNEHQIKELSYQFIVHDIVSFIEKNEDYITEDVLIQYLKDGKVPLRNVYKLTDHIIYNNYTTNEIKNILLKLKNLRIIKVKRNETKYGKFKTLQINQKLPNVMIQDFDPFTKKSFNDYQAEKVFLVYKEITPIDTSTLIMLLSLVKTKGFIAKYKKEYIIFLKAGSDNFKKLIKMKLDTETNSQIKRIYEEILE